MRKQLQLTLIEEKRIQVGEDEIARVLPLPDNDYNSVKKDFAIATHLAGVDALCLDGAQVVFVKASAMHDALLAAAYIVRKGERDGAIPEYEECYDGNGAPCGNREVDGLFYGQKGLVRVPIVTSAVLRRVFDDPVPQWRPFGSLGVVSERVEKPPRPYWVEGNYPLIVLCNGPLPTPQAVKKCGRLLVFLMVDHEAETDMPASSMESSCGKDFAFEVECEYLTVTRPSDAYCQSVLSALVCLAGYRLGSDVDKVRVTIRLQQHRGRNFNGAADIGILVKKAIRAKKDSSRRISSQHLEKCFDLSVGKLSETPSTEVTSEQELEQLIGLSEVKRQIRLLVKRMGFEATRQNKGLPSSPAHMAAVFMGNPGTAKTTVARLFGRMLNELGLLESGKFVEVTRKDLVGRYVGWTAVKVAETFANAKGGTLFIDEAYSLMNEGPSDGYSDEATAEIVAQMENNPDTLVIFAGYTDKMRSFVANANPGLRSRLTNIIEFPDYSVLDMAAILVHLAKKEGYCFAEEMQVQGAVEDLLSCIREANLGNGRLMRSLFKAALSYHAAREDADYVTITADDLSQAARDIKRASMLLCAQMPKRAGF